MNEGIGKIDGVSPTIDYQFLAEYGKLE